MGDSEEGDDQKRCMPLVNGDMCPIAIDKVNKNKKAEMKEEAELPQQTRHYEPPADEEDFNEDDEDEYMHDHPVVEKVERYTHESSPLVSDHDEYYEGGDKHRHHEQGRYVYEGEYRDEEGDLELLEMNHENEEDFEGVDEDLEHENVVDGEDLHDKHPEVWRPQLHSTESLDFHPSEEEIVTEETPAAPKHESMKLAPKVPKKDDPRINIP